MDANAYALLDPFFFFLYRKAALKLVQDLGEDAFPQPNNPRLWLTLACGQLTLFQKTHHQHQKNIVITRTNANVR